MPSAHNTHGNLIAIDGKGVLITGYSGSGKTLLALHLFRRCHIAKIKADWIADDQVMLDQRNNQLIGSSPGSIRGKVEIRGFGIVEMPVSNLQQTEIALHVVLDSQANIVRLWDGQSSMVAGVPIDTLTLSANNVEAAGNAVLAMLGHPVWI